MPEPIVDRAAVIAAVEQAGALAMTSWRDGAAPDTRVWSKGNDSPVSDIDMAVDALLKERLTQILPEAAWLSEETADDAARLDSRLLWLVDPIDGTRDYVRGRNGWCVSVALVADGKPHFAIMAAPAQQKLWVAAHGEGVTCNGDRLTGCARQEFAGARVPADDLPKIDHDLVTVTKPNSIAMRMTMVACDRADLVATLRWGHEWDVAAAHLVAQEAGAVVTDALGQPLSYNKRDPRDFGLICCAPGIHEAAVQRLEDRARKYMAP
ncbi:3'(2'),5'-bisphosphate nucleotidase CysQ [Sphingorhabdus contaminans]|uniref:3'(2'),5'-bisphosphate nucleotidase CysQ n=1 Tax=Sphingorhabdus contaminans TaxID=1343899 RepID=A0A553WH94_9SPHN|nr:3'(2'),5'-bisphosphate nucleotidase CysQ [Sphingorhabdus contaminans]TSB04014.1 3'(2'),5'-bisphosphate nucleotidase CysQ [Sphingorhabdus contaminans]